jgi:hypothetical protein
MNHYERQLGNHGPARRYSVIDGNTHWRCHRPSLGCDFLISRAAAAIVATSRDPLSGRALAQLADAVGDQNGTGANELE